MTTLITSLIFALAAWPGASASAQTCGPALGSPAIEALKRANRLSPVEAFHARAQAGWLVAPAGAWVYSLKNNVMVDVNKPEFTRVTLVEKTSGHLLVVYDLGTELGQVEFVPTPGVRALVTSGTELDPERWAYMLDEDGRWRPREKADGPALRGARREGPILAHRDERRGLPPAWRLTTPGGERLYPDPGDPVELRDGRRLAADDLGTLHELPAKGFALGLATETSDLALKGFFMVARPALDQALTTLPPAEELGRALPLMAHAHHQDFFAALVGPAVDGERWVLLLTMNAHRFVWPGETKPGRDVELVNGWRVYARGGRWYTRDDGRPPDEDDGVPSAGAPKPPPLAPGAAVRKRERAW